MVTSGCKIVLPTVAFLPASLGSPSQFRSLQGETGLDWHQLSLASIAGCIPVGMAVTRPDGCIEYANPHFEALLRTSGGALLGRKLDAYRCASQADESCFRSGEGAVVHVQETICPIREGGAVHFLKDLSSHKLAESLSLLAFYDALTGLPNRNLFQDRLAQAVAAAERRGTDFALLYIDIDRFKDINDTWGHDIGDRVLRETAARMSRALRRSDTLARVGGDEFAALLEEVTDDADAREIAEKLIACCAERLRIDGTSLHFTSSIGIGLYPRDGRDPAALLKRADRAMYRAKAQGRNRCCIAESLPGSLLEPARMTPELELL